MTHFSGLWDNFDTLEQHLDNLETWKLRNKFEISRGQFWDNFDATRIHFLDNFGATLGQLWDKLDKLRDNFGTNLKLLWDNNLEITMKLFGHNFEAIWTALKQLWDKLKTTLRQLGANFETTWDNFLSFGQLFYNFWTFLGPQCGYFVTFGGACLCWQHMAVLFVFNTAI